MIDLEEKVAIKEGKYGLERQGNKSSSLQSTFQ